MSCSIEGAAYHLQGEAQPLHQKHVTCDSSEIREVATQFVTDLIYKAKEVAQRQQSRIEEVDEEEEEEEMPPPRRIIDLKAGPAKVYRATPKTSISRGKEKETQK